MKLYGDYHTHTFESDGRGSVEQTVVSAINKGLKQVAITDHGFSHLAQGISRKRFYKQKEQIVELRKKYPQIEILHGTEANLMGLEGQIDVKPEERKDFDVMIVGYHLSYKAINLKNWFNFWLRGVLGLQTKKQIQKNTQAYINAIKKHDIDIVAHLNHACKVDPVEVAKVAKEYETYIELNGKKINMSDQQIVEVAKTGVKFIINSDGHRSENVGRNNMAFAIIERLNIPRHQVVNLNDVPKFKNYNLDKKY